MTTRRVVIASLSAAMDGSFVAVAEVSGAMETAGAADDYRPIGGVAVMRHVQRLGLDLPLRATADADVDAAWREANQSGCSEALWMELARRREKDHPEDALEVYKRWVGPAVLRGNNQAYEEAVELLERCRRLLVRLGRADEVPGFVAAFRSEFARRRNFAKLVDARRWDTGRARRAPAPAAKRGGRSARHGGTRP